MSDMNTKTVLSENVKGGDRLRNLGVDGNSIITDFRKRQGVRLWT
jgi:hypothetical protein